MRAIFNMKQPHLTQVFTGFSISSFLWNLESGNSGKSSMLRIKISMHKLPHGLQKNCLRKGYTPPLSLNKTFLSFEIFEFEIDLMGIWNSDWVTMM